MRILGLWKAPEFIVRSEGEGKMKRLILVSLLLMLASPAGAAVYKWVDERGVVNFADDLEKVPPAYRDGVEEVKIPRMPTPGVPPGKTSTKAPPISQTLIREGDLAIKLADALKVGRVQSEAEAESLLASAGIAPRNGWIADYPVTPDIIGELQNTVTQAADSGKLAMKRDEALKAFQNLAGQQNLPVSPDLESQYVGSEQPTAEAEPPENYPEYYEPSEINNYYYDQGPPIVTYYPPPWDYYYLYAWVPYPFWFSGFWFPGFFCLHDFHRGVFIDGHRRFISNHFWDSGGKRFGTIDPARRHTGNPTANLSHPTRGFSSPLARNGASSILNRSVGQTVNRPTRGISGNKGGRDLPNSRVGMSGGRPSTGYRGPFPGNSPGRRGPSGRPGYASTPGHRQSSSNPGMGVGRSFSSSSRGGNPGFRGGNSGSRGSSGGIRGFSGGGGRGFSGGDARGRR